MIKVAMFDTKLYDRAGFEKYSNENDIAIKYFETKLTEDTVNLTKGYDAVIVFVNDMVSKNVIDELKNNGVKLVALRCAGFNNVDVKSAFNKVHIMRVPAYSPYAVAEHAMAMLLTSVRRIHKAFNRTREFNFSLNGLAGFDLHGKTVGVIGTGKIGKVFIDICKGFGMNVIAYDLYPDRTSNINYVTLDELFEKSDIISMHCPLTSDTEYLINENSIDKMKKGVVIINTSRGKLIDAESLLNGIKNKKIGAACLDVYEEETDIFFEDYSGHIMQDDVLARLLSMPNVLITSHQAFLTEEALDNIAKVTIDNILDFFNGVSNDNELCYQCENKEECKKRRKEKCF